MKRTIHACEQGTSDYGYTLLAMTHALIFLESSFSTMKLRQALDATRMLSQISVARDMGDFKELLKLSPGYDLVFLRGQLPSKNLLEMIAELRLHPALHNAAIIVITSDVNHKEFSFAQNLLSRGRIDGVLLEPYSVDGLQEVITIAKTAPRGFSDATIRKILKLLVREICDQITDVARHLRCGHPTSVSRHILQDTASVIEELPEAYQLVFLEYLNERCERSRPSRIPPIQLIKKERPTRTIAPSSQSRVVRVHK